MVKKFKEFKYSHDVGDSVITFDGRETKITHRFPARGSMKEAYWVAPEDDGTSHGKRVLYTVEQLRSN